MATKKSGKLFLVAGPSASGKSTVISALTESDSQFVSHRKGTTRPLRLEDTDVWSDPRLCQLEGNENQVIYLTNGGFRYGIDLDKIRSDLERGLNVVMVCVDHGATEHLRTLFPGQAISVFIHRDFTPEMRQAVEDRGGLERLVARARAYDQLAAGLSRPDYVVLNTGSTISEAVEQVSLIAQKQEVKVRTRQSPFSMLHIVVSPSGKLKDALEEACWSYPGWGRSFIQKEKMPAVGELESVSGEIRYRFFGNEYRVKIQDVISNLNERAVGFITVADIEAARKLKAAVEGVKKNKYLAQIHYLHQSPEEILADMENHPEGEREARMTQATDLLKLYQKELILEAHPLLPVGGEENIFAWVQRCIRERPLGEARDFGY